MRETIPEGAVRFIVACPEISSELSTALRHRGRPDVASELEKIFVVSRIQGPPDNISFGAYAVPGLTYEERMATALRDWEELSIPLRGGVVTFSLDDFGATNYLHIKKLPEIYNALKAANIPTDEKYPPDVRARVEAERARMKEEAKQIRENSEFRGRNT
jgi:hypothetical protein